MDTAIYKNVLKQIDKIENDLQSGSTTITKVCIDVFTEAYSAAVENDDKKSLSDIAHKLIAAKPTMAAVINIVNRCLQESKNYDGNDFTPIAESIKKDMDRAGDIIIGKAVNKIFIPGKKNIVITCSYSSNIIKTFEKAAAENIDFTVMVLRSEWKGNKYHDIVIEDCSNFGVSAEMFEDTDIPGLIDLSDAALIGADAILNGTSVINGFPSYKLARKINKDIPFYVVAESFKNSDHCTIDDGFDYVPSDYITSIISDHLFIKNNQ